MANQLISPELNLSGVATPKLSFWHQYDMGTGDRGNFFVSTNGGITWYHLAWYTGQSSWTQATFDLSDYAGKTILLMFEYVTDGSVYGDGWHVDDISIPEIGFFDGVESGPGGWTPDGWTIVEKPGPPTSIFVAHFMKPEGEPYPFDLIISDGTSRQAFTNVTYVETEVPSNATYTLASDWGGFLEMHQFVMPLPAGESVELEFYAIDPRTVLPRARPYLLGKEVGADVDVSWEYIVVTEKEFLLSYDVKVEPPSKRAFVGGWISAAADDPYVMQSYVADGVPSSISSCPNETKFDEEANGGRGKFYWDHTPIVIEPFPVGSTHVDVTLEQVDENRVPVGVRRVLHNDALIGPYSMQLLDVDGVAHDPDFLYPQWVRSPGSYIVRVLGLPGEYAQELRYPVHVSDAAFTLDAYPPKAGELSPFTFGIAGQNFFADSSYSGVTHDEKNHTLSVSVHTEIRYDWWGSFVLPASATVAAARSYDGVAWHDLSELYDYTVNSVAGYKVVVVRISPETEQLMLRWAPAPVGGTVKLPAGAVAAESGAAAEGSGWATATWAALAGSAVAIGIGGWYARRRWLR